MDMSFLHSLFEQAPLLALFITIALGYFVGKFRVKRFVLGGIAGSLLVGVLIGQLGIKLPTGIGGIFFALFIYAVGYQGGAQFFRSLNKEMAIQLFSASVTCVLGLLCVLAAAIVFHLDRGTAAGLAAGALTQSAMIGTASSAIAKLHLSSHVTQVMQSNVAVGYAVCYIFGSFGPILLLATVFPSMMGWDLRKEAIKLAKTKAGDQSAPSAGEFNALQQIDTRVYCVSPQSSVIGKTVISIFENNTNMAIEALMRNNALIDMTPTTVLQPNDTIAVTGKIQAFAQHQDLFGPEVDKPQGMQLIEETRQVVLTNKKYNKTTIGQWYQKIDIAKRYGVFITSISHLGEKIPADSNTVLHRGDEIELAGRSADLNRVSKLLGRTLSAAPITDFIFFGLGMAIGVLLGLISFKVLGISVTLGSGVGCLFSGLIFGWLRSTHPRFGALPTGASNFLRDFGLAVFVSVIGITAGPQAIQTIKQYGMELFFLGVGVTLIPQIITFYFSYYILRIKNPITLLATIAGGKSANPGFAALLDKAGNSTPVVSFTATYAIANILLTLWGPVIIGLITKNYG